jgi:hypothetical protein
VGSCELPNWIQAPREVNACRSRSTTLALFFPSGMQTAIGKTPPALAPGPAGGVPMSRPIRANDYVEHFDPDLSHHRAWLQAVLERLVAHELDNRPDKTEFEFSKAIKLYNFIIHSAITSASILAASLPVRAAIVAYTDRNAFLAAFSSSSSENYNDLATGTTGNWFSHQFLWLA